MCYSCSSQVHKASESDLHGNCFQMCPRSSGMSADSGPVLLSYTGAPCSLGYCCSVFLWWHLDTMGGYYPFFEFRGISKIRNGLWKWNVDLFAISTSTDAFKCFFFLHIPSSGPVFLYTHMQNMGSDHKVSNLSGATGAFGRVKGLCSRAHRTCDLPMAGKEA